MNFSFPTFRLMFPLLLSALSPAAVIAIPPEQVSDKLDTIIVFAPVSSKSADKPQPLRFELDGEKRSVYFAAFSPAAVSQIINDRLIPQKFKKAKKLKFAPFSLSKFDSLVQPSLEVNADARVLYVPDPTQVPYTKKLLIEQGVDKKIAEDVSVSVPSVFCPNPAILATPNEGSLKGQSFIPCSTDYVSVKNMVDKGRKDSKELRNKDLKVVALPITSFASMLSKGPIDDVSQIRVLPNPANVNAINELKKSL
jgi:hypothetical protein